MFNLFTVLSLGTRDLMLFCSGEHAAAMHEEHAGQLHQAQAHHTRWVHLRWTGFLDTTGILNFPVIEKPIFVKIV